MSSSVGGLAIQRLAVAGPLPTRLLATGIALFAPALPAATIAVGPVSLALQVEATVSSQTPPGDVDTDQQSLPAGNLGDISVAAVAASVVGNTSAGVSSAATATFAGTTSALVDFATTWTLSTAADGGGIAYANLFSLPYTPAADGFLSVAYDIDFSIPRLTRRGSSPFAISLAGSPDPAIAMSFLDTTGTLAGSRSFPVLAGVPVTLLITEAFAIEVANFTGAENWSGRFEVDFAPAAVIPLPAAGWLLFGGVATLAALRPRRTS